MFVKEPWGSSYGPEGFTQRTDPRTWKSVTPLNRKPEKFLLQVRNHWAFVQEKSLEALCRVEKPGVGRSVRRLLAQSRPL